MLNYYIVIHSTVTKSFVGRLLYKSIIHQSIKRTIMRTLDRNTLTEKPKNTLGYTWNSKRRFR